MKCSVNVPCYLSITDTNCIVSVNITVNITVNIKA